MSTAIRILYIITLPGVGGAQSHVLALIRGVAGAADIHLATSAKGPLTEAAESFGAVVHILPSLGRSINPFNDIQSVRECLQLIRDVHPALVHLHSSKAGVVGRIAAKRAGVPAIFTAHGWGFKPGVPVVRRSIVWLSEALAAPLATRVICVSDYDRQLACRYLPGGEEKYTMIHNGICAEAPLAFPDADNVKIIMTARFQEPKEQQLLLRAFAMLDRPRAQILFAGEGNELVTCQAIARNLGIAENVHFLGDRNDISNLLAQSQIFVLLSRYEGLPISVLEAMRAGLPVIASRVGGIPEQVDNGATGFLIDPGDVSAVASALSTLIAGPKLRRQMGEAGRRKFRQKFMVEEMLAQTIEVYEQALSSASSFSTYYP
jgi:glycosyltransferase involved in cell wall biosynthesis